jgi:hypothetical protein
MINKDIETHQWVSISRMSVEDLRKVLTHIQINRYGLGGVESVNKGIREIIGDVSFWDKFVWSEFSGGKKGWRLGSVDEQVMECNELQFAHMFKDDVDLSKL